jgi:hypothetical protein
MARRITKKGRGKEKTRRKGKGGLHRGRTKRGGFGFWNRKPAIYHNEENEEFSKFRKITVNPDYNLNQQEEGDINELNKLLIKASYHGYIKQVEAYVNAGADVNSCISDEELLTIGIQANEKILNNKCTNALHLASEKGHVEVVEFLLDNGADINAKTGRGYTALMYAKLNNHENVEKLLISRGAVNE